MITLKNDTVDKESINFIYSGLGSISKNGRKHLKNIAQSLIAMQSRTGFPVPENICREIMRDPANAIKGNWYEQEVLYACGVNKIAKYGMYIPYK